MEKLAFICPVIAMRFAAASSQTYRFVALSLPQLTPVARGANQKIAVLQYLSVKLNSFKRNGRVSLVDNSHNDRVMEHGASGGAERRTLNVSPQVAAIGLLPRRDRSPAARPLRHGDDGCSFISGRLQCIRRPPECRSLARGVSSIKRRSTP